jgi:hypothetical protein
LAARHCASSFGNKRMRLAVILAICAAGCGHAGQPLSADETARHEIVGSWSFSDGHGVVTVRSNGTFSTVATNQAKKFAYKGTWDIRNGELVMCLTQSSEPQFQAVGQTNRLQILKLNSTTLVHFDPSLGQTNTLHRNL